MTGEPRETWKATRALDLAGEGKEVKLKEREVNFKDRYGKFLKRQRVKFKETDRESKIQREKVKCKESEGNG